jgi:hypothetical protein
MIAKDGKAMRPTLRADSEMVRKMVQAIGTILCRVVDEKGFFKRCEEVLLGSTVCRKWKSLDNYV